MSTSASLPKRLGAVEWLICVIAAIGFAFDIYELLMAQFIIRPAILELTGATPGTKLYGAWASALFYVPALAGGAFGLLGGYLTDRLGRRRILTWSILIYAFSAFAAGFSTSIEMLLFFRCTTFIGVCVEFVAAVAWLAELFPNPKQRERVLGYTQAFSSIGGLLVALAYKAAVMLAPSLPAIAIPAMFAMGGTIDDPHAPWRYTLMSGLIPAIPLILIRPFLPESPVWERRRVAGTLRRPSLRELFSPELARTTIVTTLMFACSYGVAFGALQQTPQIVPGTPEVRALTKGKPPKIAKKIEQDAAATAGTFQEIGGLVGRLFLAFLAVRIASRRLLLRVFQVPGIIVVPVVFALIAPTNLTLLYGGVFLAGLVTVAQFSFWGNYLPRVYPVHLRGTGEGFAANIGGRMLGTSMAFVTNTLAVSGWMPGASAPEKMAYTAAAVALAMYLIGFVLSFFLPEPGLEQMAD